jgi:hypothetical protein
MRYVVAAIVGLFVTAAMAGAINSAPTEIRQPWQRVEHPGYLFGPDDLRLFGEGYKSLTLCPRSDRRMWEIPLCFASDADYREAEKHIGVAVRLTCLQVRNGSQAWMLVESVEMVK